MIGTLKCPYPGLTTEITSDILTQIQTSIRQKVSLSYLKSFSALFDEQIIPIPSSVTGSDRDWSYS